MTRSCQDIVDTSENLLIDLGGFWFEIDNDYYWRVFAVVAVLVAAFGLAIPIRHRATAEPRRIVHCPFCGEKIEGATVSSATCLECETTFRVVLDA